MGLRGGRSCWWADHLNPVCRRREGSKTGRNRSSLPLVLHHQHGCEGCMRGSPKRSKYALWTWRWCLTRSSHRGGLWGVVQSYGLPDVIHSLSDQSTLPVESWICFKSALDSAKVPLSGQNDYGCLQKIEIHFFCVGMWPHNKGRGLPSSALLTSKLLIADTMSLLFLLLLRIEPRCSVSKCNIP